MSKPLKIFITYSHKNTTEKDELITRLALLKREGIISIWHDNEIQPGDKWRDAVFSNLADSDLLLYLTSAYSLESENCNKELASALNAEIRIIPIILEHCDWLNHQLSNFQALPDRGLPITKWKDKSEGWQNVVDGIRKTIDKMQVQTDPSSGISEGELYAELAFQRGNVLTMLGQLDMAIDAYSHVIELNRCDADAYNNRGAAYQDKGEFDLAIQDFNRAIEFEPDYAIFHYNRGVTYGKKGNYDIAIQNYTKAIELETDYVEAYNNRGNAHERRGNSDQALKDYNRAIELNPTFAKVYYSRGTFYRGKNKIDEAIRDYSTAIQLEPDYIDAYLNRGTLYRSNGKVDEAIWDYSAAIRLSPYYAKAYNNRGNTYYEKGEYDQAINVTQVHGEAALVFDPQKTQEVFEASVFWIRKQASITSEQEAVEDWQFIVKSENMFTLVA